MHPSNREHTVISGTLGSHKLITCKTQKSISKFCKVEMVQFDHSVIKLETNSTIKKTNALKSKSEKRHGRNNSWLKGGIKIKITEFLKINSNKTPYIRINGTFKE